MTRILHIADLHFGREDPRLVDALADIENDNPPDVIVAAGDLTTFGSRKEFAAARELFARFKAPVVCAPGNHDVPYANLFSRFVAPWKRFEKRMQGTLVSCWSNDEAAVETYQTARGAQLRLDWSLGQARPDHAQGVVQRLDEQVGRDKLRIVSCHHPILSPHGGKGRAKTTHAPKALSVFHEGQTDLVLTGHLHQVFALAHDSDDHRCWYVGASTALSKRTRDEPAGFNVITAEPDVFLMDVFVTDGEGQFVHSEQRRLERMTGR